MTHGDEWRAPAIPEALSRALMTTGPESVQYYSELSEIGLGDSPARDTWRKLMRPPTYFPGRGTLFEETYLEGKADGEARGRAEERAQLILKVLTNRGVSVSEESNQRIVSCSDLDTLAHWLDRALNVATEHEIFADTP
ncbi:hypothetical protein [Streptomyces sp. YIM 130001]|uniref:hypothetical protein n=1 Tax=Streptomyces sp. YIM 130001 TaxID=2259644 RepID=UPI003204A1E9